MYVDYVGLVREQHYTKQRNKRTTYNRALCEVFCFFGFWCVSGESNVSLTLLDVRRSRHNPCTLLYVLRMMNDEMMMMMMIKYILLFFFHSASPQCIKRIQFHTVQFFHLRSET